MDDEDSIEILRTDIADFLDIEIPKKSKKEPEEPARRKSKKSEPDPEEDEPDLDDIPKKDRCIACGGTGKNSRGKTCPICDGIGRKPKEKPVDAENGVNFKKHLKNAKNSDDCRS